ncbi:hypothetical protein IMSAGC006_01811 [Muribaculaceae bacterium]|nr:hypothetical protein IMSAGC006_01811 [Muribaculaceae bacterium]
MTKRKIANSFGISDLTFLEVVPPDIAKVLIYSDIITDCADFVPTFRYLFAFLSLIKISMVRSFSASRARKWSFSFFSSRAVSGTSQPSKK